MTKNKIWNKNTVLFLASQNLSLFGSMLVQYAITWYITLQTQSGVMMMISIICGFLPTFFISPFAGVWADRYSKKKLIAISDSLIALSTLFLAISFYSGYEQIWTLFVASAIRAVGTGVQSPAVNAFIPLIVKKENLTKVNGINTGIQSSVMLLSPMLSGALLTIASIKEVFFVDIGSAVIAVAILLLFVDVKEKYIKDEGEPITYFEDIKLGIIYIRDHTFLKQFFIFCTIYFFLAVPVALLTPLQVARTFGSDVWRLTAIEIVFSVGMMIGGLIIAAWGGFKNRVHSMAVSALTIAIFTVGLGIVNTFSVYLVFMGLIGLVMPLFNTPSTVLLQEKVNERYLGRVFGVLGMISSIIMPLGMLIFGPISDFIKIEWLLIFTGVLLLIQSILMFKNNILLRAGQPEIIMEEI